MTGSFIKIRTLPLNLHFFKTKRGFEGFCARLGTLKGTGKHLNIFYIKNKIEIITRHTVSTALED